MIKQKQLFKRRKRIWNPFSLVSKVSFSMLIITLCSIIAMLTSAWVANSVQGNAHAINRIGFMRMQSFEMLSLVPLTRIKDDVLSTIDRSNHSQFLDEFIQSHDLIQDYQHVQQYWLNQVQPALLKASSPDEARPIVIRYVEQLDQLVHLIDKETEYRLWILKTLQTGFILLLLLLLFVNVIHLHRRIFYPWRKLLTMALELKNGDFRSRFPVENKRDEMNQLGIMLNSMADKLETMYSNLESLVATKTKILTHKNTVLDFLYRASGTLLNDNSDRYCALFSPIVFELKAITGYQQIALEIIDYHNPGNRQIISTEQHQRPKHCTDLTCQACFTSSFEENPSSTNAVRSWELEDGQRNYGVLKVELSHESDDDLQLIDTLSRHITRALASKYQEHLNSELMLANERATIARELHDSIAQSLSCMKIRLSCLQMQNENFSYEQNLLIKEVRNEVGTAYTQLRHLLSTFRLKLTEPGLLPALENTISEFNEKLNVDIDLSFDIPANSISSHQAVHIVHIVREALSNIYKHANATKVHIDAKYDSSHQKVIVVVADNGCGMATISEPKNHYGLTIMHDRARLLPGRLNIESKEGEGTYIHIEFAP